MNESCLSNYDVQQTLRQPLKILIERLQQREVQRVKREVSDRVIHIDLFERVIVHRVHIYEYTEFFDCKAIFSMRFEIVSQEAFGVEDCKHYNVRMVRHIRIPQMITLKPLTSSNVLA